MFYISLLSYHHVVICIFSWKYFKIWIGNRTGEIS